MATKNILKNMKRLYYLQLLLLLLICSCSTMPSIEMQISKRISNRPLCYHFGMIKYLDTAFVTNIVVTNRQDTGINIIFPDLFDEKKGVLEFETVDKAGKIKTFSSRRGTNEGEHIKVLPCYQPPGKLHGAADITLNKGEMICIPVDLTRYFAHRSDWRSSEKIRAKFNIPVFADSKNYGKIEKIMTIYSPWYPTKNILPDPWAPDEE